MSDIADLEQRISAALARIEAGLDLVGPGRADSLGQSGDGAEMVALKDALDVERITNAQLEERVKAIKGKQDSTVGQLEQWVEKLRDKLTKLESEVQQLRQTNATLRETAGQLRRSSEAQVGDPHLINRVMLAELESLRATREAEKTEVDGILDELQVLVEGGR